MINTLLTTYLQMSDSLFTRIKHVFKPPTDQLERDRFVVDYAFTCGGVDYYEFKDKNNLPYERGLESLTFFQELQNGVTNDYLKAHCEQFKRIIENPKQINISEIIRLYSKLEDRLQYIVSKDVIYRVASVVFIDKTENPLRYDYEYNWKKIAHWKKHDADSFFLREPLKRLIPFLQLSGNSSLMYLQTVELIEAILQNETGEWTSEKERRTESA